MILVSASDQPENKSAEKKITVAAYPFTSTNVDKAVGAMLYKMLLNDLGQSKTVSIIAQDTSMEVEKMLAYANSDKCDMFQSKVEIGKAVPANKILVGEIGKLGSKYIISGRVSDIQKNVVEFSFTQEKVCSEEDLDQLISQAALEIRSKFGEKIERPNVRTPTQPPPPAITPPTVPTETREEQKMQAQQQGPTKGTEYGFDIAKGAAPVIGDVNAKVKVVIFSDFQCPYCEKMSGILEDIQKEHPRDVAIFYKNFVVHQGALLEHVAAMSAFDQGNFKQMHDLLFKNRKELTGISGQGEDQLKEKLVELGKQAGLNAYKLKSDLDSGKYQELITSNKKEGQQAGVYATPSVFINGYFYGYDPDEVKKQIEEALNK